MAKLTAKMVAAMTRPELEAAYVDSIPADYRELTIAKMATFSDDYLRLRLAPPKQKRDKRIARHCNDRGFS